MTETPAIVQKQPQYMLARRILRDLLLRPIGLTFLVQPRITGQHFIPDKGPTLLVMNHIGFIDPVVVLGAVTSRWVVPMSKIENFQIPGIAQLSQLWGAYPVDRSKMDRTALQNTIDLLHAGHCILIAPEGTRQPAMLAAKPGFTYVATKTNAAIVPIGLSGTAAFDTNIKRLKPTPIEIRFGRAFNFKHSGRGRVPRDTMQQMTTEAMYQLAKLVDPEQRGVYADMNNATTQTLNFL
mgnify:CR=1 FL=1